MREGWIDCTLLDICSDGGVIQTGPFGSQLHAADYRAEGIPVVMPVNIGDNRIIEANVARVEESDAIRLSKHRMNVGDIVYSRRGDITRRALIRKEQRGWLCGTGCLLVRPNSKIDSRWLSFWLGTPQVHKWLVRHSVGATMLNLNTGILSELPVQLPPLDEQRRIAGVLAALDDLIEINTRMQLELQEIRRATFRRVIEISNEIVSFGEIATLSTDHVAPSNMKDDSIYLGLEHFGENGIGLISTGTAQGVGSQKSQFRAGDVLYGKLRPYFRKVARPDFAGICSTEIWVIRPTHGIGPEFLEWIVSSEEFTEFAMRGSGGTRMPRAVWEHVSRMPVNLPKPKLLSRAAAISGSLWEQIWTLRSENQALLSTRDELLPLLLSGAVTVAEVAA